MMKSSASRKITKVTLLILLLGGLFFFVLMRGHKHGVGSNISMVERSARQDNFVEGFLPSLKAKFRGNVTSGDSVKRTAYEKARLEQFEKTFPLLLDVRGLPPAATSFFQFDNESTSKVNAAIESARSSLQNEIISRIEKIDGANAGVVEYRVSAFPEAGDLIKKALVAQVCDGIGSVYGEAAMKGVDTNFAHFLGWGKFDMKFMLYPIEGRDENSPSSWNLELIYYIPGTPKEAASISIPLSEAIPVIGIFEGAVPLNSESE